jgi:DNA-binding IclR family transcriptional regulator
LTDVPSDLLRREQVPGLEELRLQAVEWRLDAGLELGLHSELVPELQSLARRFPLRERLHAQLMLALVRCDRQAEALEAYQSARQELVEELGTEPGAGLREIHQRILTADPALAVPQSTAVAGDRLATAVPRELPAPVAGFVGRAEELAALASLLNRPAEEMPAVVISAIGGTAGVGKTALALQWAHRAARRFPDGQLYANLRGYDPDRPMSAGDALAGFLRALGVPGPDIPADEDERAAKYRSLLAGKKVLVVLDNVRSEEQVRPLLPGSASCAVVVTSRDSLAGLVARDGATRVEVDLLPLAEAVSLLRQLIGQRVDDDPGAAETLADQCCRLPLVLRVAAELATARPDVALVELAGELADQQRRLDLLDAGGDPRTAGRAVFSWSYRHLENDSALAFRLAGLHPGPDFEAYAAAALTGMTLEQARTVLDTLTRAHLIQPTRTGRYGMHDLLRAYARELAARDGEDEQQAVPPGLSPRFSGLLGAAETAESLVGIADPVMCQLAEQTGETVILVRLIGRSPVCVHRVESARRLRIAFEPGQPLPLERGASTRMLLAGLPADLRREYVAPLAERDPDTAASLQARIAVAAQRGWAVSEEEVEQGVWAVSAAVMRGKRMVAALTVPSPLVRAPAQMQDRVLGQVRSAARAISEQLRPAATKPHLGFNRTT